MVSLPTIVIVEPAESSTDSFGHDDLGSPIAEAMFSARNGGCARRSSANYAPAADRDEDAMNTTGYGVDDSFISGCGFEDSFAEAEDDTM